MLKGAEAKLAKAISRAETPNPSKPLKPRVSKAGLNPSKEAGASPAEPAKVIIRTVSPGKHPNHRASKTVPRTTNPHRIKVRALSQELLARGVKLADLISRTRPDLRISRAVLKVAKALSSPLKVKLSPVKELSRADASRIREEAAKAFLSLRGISREALGAVRAVPPAARLALILRMLRNLRK